MRFICHAPECQNQPRFCVSNLHAALCESQLYDNCVYVTARSHTLASNRVRSLRHIRAQVVDDRTGRTLAAASSLDKDVRGDIKGGGNVAAAKVVGKTIAGRALKAGIEKVVFDRGGYRYHGRVQALADAAREAGLKF